MNSEKFYAIKSFIRFSCQTERIKVTKQKTMEIAVLSLSQFIYSL